jgi:hypothetical protein
MHESEFVAHIADFLFNDHFHNTKCKNYLEMGVNAGNTFNRVAPHCELACAVDKNDCYSYISHNPNLRWFQMTTDEFVHNILPRFNIQFGLVFIDAWHSHDQSLKDFSGVAPYVVEGGIIILHDTYPPDEDSLSPGTCNDCYKTAWHIRTKLGDEYEIVTLPPSYGLSIVRKAKKQLLWMPD